MFKKYMKTRDSKKDHAILSASGAERWLNCPASVKLSAGKPQPSHESADRGTNAHTLLQFILENKNPLKLLESKEATEFKEFIGFSVEQLDAVLVAVLFIHNQIIYMMRESGVNPKMFVEQKLELKGVGFGTADVILYQLFGVLHVIDYKNGKYKVEPQDNPQLLYYGVAAADKVGWDFRRLFLTVVQPNAPHPDGPIRTWNIGPERLERAKLMFERGAARTREENPAVVPNNKYCWFCPARLNGCPAHMKEREIKIMERFKR